MERTANRWVYTLCRHWLLWFGLVFGLFVLLPFLAPVLMHLGWESAGNAIYQIYSLLCHQLPERSFFFFGPKISYSLSEIQTAWQNTNNPMVLRQFTGSAALGWKVAWSDRMVAMYASLWLFGLLWRPLRLGHLPWWGFLLLLLPMAVDGTSHLVSDLFGIGQGFRDSNAWLAVLTGNQFPVTFYAGDALGSFNSWMRLLSGVLFGLGVAWFAFPYIDEAFIDITRSGS
jgi:uncharacterized membrane protein